MVNYLAVFVVSVIGFIIGMLWYSPLLFGKQWLKLSKVKNPKPNAVTLIIAFIVGLVFNYVLAWVIQIAGAPGFVSGMGIAALIWLGFIATTILGGVLYEKMPIGLYLINSLQYLIAMLVAGGILGIWQ